ncbi:MAG: M15 family metallopeptidase [Peptostreptococcaceae bacterium]
MKIKQIVILGVSIIAISTFIEAKTLNTYIDIKTGQNVEQRQEENNLILVNKENPVSSEYKPENMVKCNIQFLESSTEEEKYLQKDAAKSIEDLFAKAKDDGIEFIATSAYRSYQTQKKIFNKNVSIRGIKEANKYAAKAGKSEHQTGLAIDVTNPERWFHKSTKEAIWLADNAHKFGFILRFLEGKEHITGYNFEPWHVRYVGKEVAKEIYEQGITLEEYFENK